MKHYSEFFEIYIAFELLSKHNMLLLSKVLGEEYTFNKIYELFTLDETIHQT